MKRRHWARWAGACTLGVVLSALAGFAAADATPYERMAPLEQYLMPPGSEIALARSAAPAAISDKATVLTLDSQGYQTAVRGSQRVHLSRGEVMDVAVREPRFLESEDQGTGLLQPGGVRVRSSRTRSGGRSSHSPETRRKKFSTRFAPRSRATSSLTRAGRDVLHDVEGWVPERCRRPLALAPDVPRAKSRRRQLGSQPARVSGGPRRPRKFRSPRRSFMVPVSRWSDGTTAATH